MESINEGNRAFLALTVVQDHLSQVTQYAAQQLRFGHEYQLLKDTDLRFDSPLDVVFFLWWKTINHGSTCAAELHTQPEVVVGGTCYRLAFLIEPAWLQLKKAIADGRVAWTPIAVEIDTPTVDEETAEQIGRDRALQQAGYHVFKFSWLDLTQQPARTVEDVHALVAANIQRASAELHALDPKPSCFMCGRPLQNAEGSL